MRTEGAHCVWPSLHLWVSLRFLPHGARCWDCGPGLVPRSPAPLSEHPPTPAVRSPARRDRRGHMAVPQHLKATNKLTVRLLMGDGSTPSSHLTRCHRAPDRVRPWTLAALRWVLEGSGVGSAEPVPCCPSSSWPWPSRSPPPSTGSPSGGGWPSLIGCRPWRWAGGGSRGKKSRSWWLEWGLEGQGGVRSSSRPCRRLVLGGGAQPLTGGASLPCLGSHDLLCPFRASWLYCLWTFGPLFPAPQ